MRPQRLFLLSGLDGNEVLLRTLCDDIIYQNTYSLLSVKMLSMLLASLSLWALIWGAEREEGRNGTLIRCKNKEKSFGFVNPLQHVVSMSPRWCTHSVVVVDHFLHLCVGVELVHQL